MSTTANIRTKNIFVKLSILFFCISFNLSLAQTTISYDIVLQGGRVIDPETGLDAIKNVGISNNEIVVISEEPLKGNEVIDVSGQVVSPGFIDLHVHGITNKEQEYQVKDGVTTALELESGIPDIGGFLKKRASNSIINYGGSVSWGMARHQAISKLDSSALADKQMVDISLTDDQISYMLDVIKDELADGGLGIGVPIGYFPGAMPKEDFSLYKFSGETKAPIFTHVRQGGVIAVQQAIANALVTEAPLHIVHVNSMALGDIGIAIEMVQKAQKLGFDITTEMYPYTAASTYLQSALFNDGWQEKFSIGYSDLQWVKTGERLTEETFNKYRQEGGVVIIHMMQPEWIATGINTEGTIIASDGMPYAKLAHPRTAGTFSRVLGKYVREEQALDLNTAIKKMTLLPAKRLETLAPSMKKRGRLQVGSIADITVFDPDTIIDKATFEEGLEFSEGVTYVMVNGVFVLKQGEFVNDVFPGQPIISRFKN